MISTELGIDIAAAGASSRMRATLHEMGYSPDYPKHLLPTGNPENETLLGRIVRQGMEAPLATPTIYANPDNAPEFAVHKDIDPQAELVVEEIDTAFGMFMRRLVGQNRRTLGASGDHFTEEFSWIDLLNHHDSHRFPVTLVVGQCIEVDEGAVFDIGTSGKVDRFYRPERTSTESLINIGLYVFDPAKVVLRSLEKVGVNPGRLQPVTTSPETIVNQLIADDLLGAYVLPDNTAFNVNTPETYRALLEHTASKVAA